MSSALDRLKARLNTAPMPPAQKAVVDAVKAMPVQSIVPPDAPPPAPVEKFMAVPPPRSESAPAVHNVLETAKKFGKLVIQEPAPEPASEKFGKITVQEPTKETNTGVVLDNEGGVTLQVTAETPKRGRGRPPGAKNKPKDEPTSITEFVTGVKVNTKPAPGVVTFKSITVTMTGKLNMGHFQSMDICVSQTAEYTTSPEEAFLQVTNVVKKQLDSALETIAGRTVQAPVPADVLNSTKR